MALIKTNLHKLAGSNPGFWIYKTPDAVATVVASGYFNNATNELKQGDVIALVTGVGGTLALRLVTVASATGATTVTTNGDGGEAPPEAPPVVSSGLLYTFSTNYTGAA